MILKLEQDILDTYEKGEYFHQSKNAYNNPLGANCDKCKKTIGGENPCLYHRRCDLCLECVIAMRDQK